MDIPSAKISKVARPAPCRLIITVCCVLCLGLLGSALFTFSTLMRLCTDYLSNRGHEIASIIEAQVRGPGRRNNPAFWQSIFETNYGNYSSSVVFLALMDENGNSFASAGQLPERILGIRGDYLRRYLFFRRNVAASSKSSRGRRACRSRLTNMLAALLSGCRSYKTDGIFTVDHIRRSDHCTYHDYNLPHTHAESFHGIESS